MNALQLSAASSPKVNALEGFSITYYKNEYDRAIARVTSKHGKRMIAKRQSAVEPVFDTLTQFMGMRKVNTRGLKQANKVMLTSASSAQVWPARPTTLKST